MTIAITAEKIHVHNSLSRVIFIAHLSRMLKWAFLITICPLSVVVVIVVVVVVNFSHFLLLLQNHRANSIQTLQKAALGEGDSSLFKWRASPFSKGRKLRNGGNILAKIKNLFLQNHRANSIQTCHKASLGNGDSRYPESRGQFICTFSNLAYASLFVSLLYNIYKHHKYILNISLWIIWT